MAERTDRIPSDILLKVVRPDQNAEYSKTVLDLYLGKHPDANPEKLIVSATTFGYVKLGGSVYVLDCDGCGHKVTPKNPWEVQWRVQQKGTIAIFPTFTVETSKRAILAETVSEEVPLEDFIRKFGARLDDNYLTWLKLLGRERFKDAMKKAKAEA